MTSAEEVSILIMMNVILAIRSIVYKLTKDVAPVT